MSDRNYSAAAQLEHQIVAFGSIANPPGPSVLMSRERFDRAMVVMRDAAVALRASADLLASLSALSARWRKEAGEADEDGDICCGLTRRNDADDLDALITAASSGKEQ